MTASYNDQYETETNPGSESWAYGNDAISLNCSDFSASASTHTRAQRGTRTGWDSFDGAGPRPHPRNHVAQPISGARFVKQNAVGKTVEERARDQLQRDESRRQHMSEQVRLDSSGDSDSDDEDDEDPY